MAVSTRETTASGAALPGRVWLGRFGAWELELGCSWRRGVVALVERLARSERAWLLVDPMDRVPQGRLGVGEALCVFRPRWPEEIGVAVELAVTRGGIDGVVLLDPEGLGGLWSAAGPRRLLWQPLEMLVERGEVLVVVVRARRTGRACAVDKRRRVRQESR